MKSQTPNSRKNIKVKFKPKPGQVDFTNIRWVPVINCVAKFRNKILIVQRSSRLNFYPNYWNGISGFLDDNTTLEQKVKDEFKEELGIKTKDIKSIKLGDIFHQEAPRYKKTWIVTPVLVEVRTDKIKLDWEAQNHVWINPFNARKYKLLPGFKVVLKALGAWRNW